MSFKDRTKYERGYLVDMVTQQKLYFQFNPEEINEVVGAEWAKVAIQGKHHPRLQYGGGRGRLIKFSLKVYGFDPQDNRTPRAKAQWLRSLVYPDTTQNSTIRRPPHRVLFNFGKLFRGVVCVVESVSITYSKNFTPQLEPLYFEAEMELSEFRVKAIGFKEVREGKA